MAGKKITRIVTLNRGAGGAFGLGGGGVVAGIGGGVARGGGGNGGGPVGESLVDLAAYPILTEEVGYPPSPLAKSSTTAGAGGTGQTGLGQIAMRAVADVLGWKARSDDPKGFLGALTQSFQLTEVEGHVESKWVPRTYAVQTDLSGGLTGAQASLYNRAKDALDNSLPLLDGLYPLDPEADKEFVEALRGVARSQMSELVAELGYEGGPRISRVNQYFNLLLGVTLPNTPPVVPLTVPSDPDLIGGTLGNLRDEYGIFTRKGGTNNALVNSVEDEQDTTNFRVLSDYITSLAQSWVNNLQFMGLNVATPFFGTQLVLISRQLSVTSELVDDVRFAMDSVFIGPAERQTLQIDFNPVGGITDPSIFIEDLLGWTQKFASEEATALIQSGGKFGVGQALPVMQTLARQVRGAINPANSALLLNTGYFAPRVQRALIGLSDQLDELVALSTPVGVATLPVQP